MLTKTFSFIFVTRRDELVKLVFEVFKIVSALVTNRKSFVTPRDAVYENAGQNKNVVSGFEPVTIVVTDCNDDDIDNQRMDVYVAEAFNQVAVFKLLLRIAARVNKLGEFYQLSKLIVFSSIERR
jgi:hypothetical protein